MLLAVTAVALSGLARAGRADERVDFVRDIKPILTRRCTSCHGVLKQTNDLRLDSPASIRRGGSAGPAIEPGKSTDSLLVEAITGADGVVKMPPEGDPLTAEQIDLIKKWIDGGAIAPDEPPPPDPARHWAFQLPTRPAVPAATDPAWNGNPIDRFIAAEHAKRGLRPSPTASKEVLLRRVYLDLIGLPPTRQEMRDFLADGSPDAYEKVVDRLLASPHYGERWGRHWMDVWRYSDWDGYGAEVRESQPFVWRWRDWIIESLNADKGYDQMVMEMLAGDELAPDDPATLRATGYIVRNWFRFNRHVWLDNSVEHTSKAFLGITINCARCHDHMYDPIPQQDYYRFRAFFEPHDIRTDRVPGQPDTTKDGLVRVFDAKPTEPTFLFVRGNDKQPDKEHPLTAGVPDILRAGQPDIAVAAINLSTTASYPGLRQFVQDESLKTAQDTFNNLAAMVNGLKTKRDGMDEMSRANFALLEKTHAQAQASLAAVQARIAADRATFSSPPADNAKELSLAAGKAERELALRKADQEALWAEQELSRARRELEARPDGFKLKEAVAVAEKKVEETKKALDTARADFDKPKEDYTKLSATYPTTSTGRRLALARWIASKQNPLTARVAINHLWLRHFGQPLVPSVFDFGMNGKPPTHPALLDWLAVELTDQGWKMKPIHRLIVLSQAYQQDSALDSSRLPIAFVTRAAGTSPLPVKRQSLDPDNIFLWRFNSRRLEAEAVRDATLAVAGSLDRTMFGAELDQNSGLTVPRRSIYFRSSKEKKMTYLSLFDTANVTECYRRSESIIPQQALAQANSPLSLAQARLLAKSLSAEVVALNSDADWVFVIGAFESILNRTPTDEERTTCEQFLAEQSQQFAAKQSLTAFNSGTANPVKPSDDPRQRARENLVHVLLNHNDFLTIR
jgi:PAS domain-containing protein